MSDPIPDVTPTSVDAETSQGLDDALRAAGLRHADGATEATQPIDFNDLREFDSPSLDDGE